MAAPPVGYLTPSSGLPARSSGLTTRGGHSRGEAILAGVADIDRVRNRKAEVEH